LIFYLERFYGQHLILHTLMGYLERVFNDYGVEGFTIVNPMILGKVKRRFFVEIYTSVLADIDYIGKMVDSIKMKG
jgi:hypothetical protein